MEVIQKVIDYTSDDELFYLYPLGDIHKGVIHCDEDLFGEKVGEIAEEPNSFWVGMGDYADLVTPGDFKRWNGAILAPWMKGQENNIGPTQLDAVDQALSPIWNKCLGLIEGNHESDMARINHYNMMTELLKRANQVADVPYAGVSCFVNLLFRKDGVTYTNSLVIHARHGEGSARTSGARAMAVLRLSSTFINAHITLSGHLHGQESPDIPQRLILRGGKIRQFETVACMTGAWLKAYMQGVPPCYLERWGTTPSVLGCPRIVYHPASGTMVLEKTRKTREL